MDQRLQQAIDAARSGDNREAQRLLTHLLKDDPDQVQAWFLLSHLVESEAKQKAYLGKVLALDPHHVQARQRLVHLHGVSAPAPVGEMVAETRVAETRAAAVATDSLDLLSQAEGDTVPSWMVAAGEPGVTAVPVAEPAAARAPELPLAEIPDWLQRPVSQESGETAAPVTQDVEIAPVFESVETPAPTIPSKPRTQPQAKSKIQITRWDLTLVILVMMAVLIALLLIRAFQSL